MASGRTRAVTGRRIGPGALGRALFTLAALGSLAVMLFVIPQAVAAFKYLKPGMAVPDFSLQTVDGKEMTLAELKGAPASMILFWATWSPRSEPALRDAEALLEEYGPKGFKVLAVNVERLEISHQDMQKIRETGETLGLTMPVAVDRGLETYNAFGVVATPSSAILDAEGKIVFETASYLRTTGEDIREQVEILLGLREPPAAATVAAAPAFKPQRKALLYYNLGRNLLRLGNKDKAVDKLRDAAGADDKYAEPRILLGHLLLDDRTEESSAEALELFSAAVELDPENVSALTGCGEALLELGKTDEAAGKLQKAVELDPTYTPAVSNLALALARQGKAGEAAEKFKAAMELNPLDAGTFYRRGGGSEAAGDLKAAAADYRRAIEILMNLPASGDEA